MGVRISINGRTHPRRKASGRKVSPVEREHLQQEKVDRTEEGQWLIQNSGRQICALMLLIWWLVVVEAVVAPPSTTPTLCPSECICLSQSQVICNSVLLRAIPAGLPPGVTHLSLSRAQIQVLLSDAFIGLRQLTHISLDSINLSTIKPFSFRGLPKLKEIIIQNTLLTIVNSFAFAGLQNVTSIVLSHNKITQIEAFAFAGTNFLNTLSLKHNPLKKILAHAFSGLTDTGSIELPSGINLIEPAAFEGLEGLALLELSYMDLDELQSDTFRGMLRVGRLSLKDSDLGSVRSGAFDNLARVDILEIVNNKIDALEELVFVVNASITTFCLIGNHMLASPTVVLFEVKNVIISGNHIPCDCGVDPYSNPLAVTDDYAMKNYCISPLRVRGKTLEAGTVACRGNSSGSAKARAGAWGVRTTDGVTLLAMFFTNFTFS